MITYGYFRQIYRMSKTAQMSIAALSAEEWAAWHAYSFDLSDVTFDSWQIEANKRLPLFQQLGVEVVQIPIKPDEFIDWCRKTKSTLTTAAETPLPSEMASASQSRSANQ
ncbi:hypothetical protein [Pseudorhodoplanes sinuspersici]|uniref:Uncharacterized protein n=1 Tax=Pseudorhodoplanes sinuspersici TaxID=1235591 RepID=A0A1W6ZYC5_9HYPH|nr:hypothetical protein [Pseudorhodoplanes sinuspersici]ARQ02326.1 hypothetical protein CAK95_26900 [Pseudorhodoplanes sinuspersici]RKE74154.1 hypothetical protein DFP91_2056 [Pseudorhodoplanes sinuspersici]